MCPVAWRVLPDGPALTLLIEQEHKQTNELVTESEALVPGSAEHRRLVDRIVELLREDVRDEEDRLLPRLQGALSVRQLRVLGLVWEAVRRIAPTRAHPVVARRPPGDALSALPLSTLDRSRDRIETLLHCGAGAAAPLLRRWNSALAAASRAVEHLPPFEHGEDNSTQTEPVPSVPWAMLAAVAVGASTASMVRARRRTP